MFGLASEYKFPEGSTEWLICMIEPVIILVMVVVIVLADRRPKKLGIWRFINSVACQL